MSISIQAEEIFYLIIRIHQFKYQTTKEVDPKNSSFPINSIVSPIGRFCVVLAIVPGEIGEEATMAQWWFGKYHDQYCLSVYKSCPLFNPKLMSVPKDGYSNYWNQFYVPLFNITTTLSNFPFIT